MRPQAWFPRLSPSLVSGPATGMAAVSVTTPSTGSATPREEVSAMTPAAGSAEGPAPSSAKVSVSEPPAAPAAVSVAAPAVRSTSALTGPVQVLGLPPESGVAVRDDRLSVSRVVPPVTVEVAGRVVTYQEVAVVSLPKFECATASPKPVAAVLAMTATAVVAAVVAAPAPLLPRTAYGAAQPSLRCLPVWQAAKLPKAHLRTDRLPPATKLMPRPFSPFKTAALMTRAPVLHRPQKKSENPIFRTNPRLRAPLFPFFDVRGFVIPP